MRAQSELELRILDMVEPAARGLGLDIVRVRVTGSQTPTLQIMAERPDGTMTVAACAKLSRALNPILEVEDPIAGEYSLEVSSPGIDRPLTRRGDFARWPGHEVKVELSYPNAEGRKRFHGWIEREADGVVALRLKDGGEASIAIDDMSKAVLVLTDKLIQDARAKVQAAAEVAVDADEEDFDGETDAMSDEAVEDFDDVEVDDADEFEEGLDAEGEDLESDDKE